MPRRIVFLMFIICSFQTQANDKRAPHTSHLEFNEIISSGNERYVYLGKQFSNLYEIISQINTLEDKPNSIIRELQQHIDDGFSIGLYDSVVEALSYAEKTLRKNASKISAEEVHNITHSLEVVISQIVNGALTIDPQEMVDVNSAQNKHCCSSSSSSSDSSDCCENNCAIITENNRIILPCAVKIKRGLKVFGKTKFREDVLFKDNACFEDKV